MRILFLDDDAQVLSDGLADLKDDPYHVDKCRSTAEAQAALINSMDVITDEDLIAFVDHDLGAGQEGYTFVRWLRQSHPRGHLLPIIYLTGRESERGYITHLASSPFHSPSLYLSKRDFARPSFDINDFIEQLVAEYKSSLVEVDRQRLDETMRLFDAHESGNDDL